MSGTGEHILLIDDDLDMHDAVRLILEPLGYRVTCVPTADDGLEVLRRDRPALLILDIMLSFPTEGLEVAQRLRRDPQTKEIPIVMMSAIGLVLGSAYVHGLDVATLPADALINKPFDAARLRSVVQEILGGKE